MLVTLLLATLLVAYSNGGNDNFKGVATLYGSNTTSFRTALAIGTVATLAGSLSSIVLAEGLVRAFSGKGLVPDALSAAPDFVLAVATGAAGTILLATRFGLPVSTTHALTGALVGAGIVGAGANLDLSVLGSTFVLPLLLGPLLSIMLTMPLYKLAHAAVDRFRIGRQTCLCVGPSQFVPVSTLSFDAGSGAYSMPAAAAGLDVTLGTTSDCIQKYQGHMLGMSAQGLVNAVHYLSAVAVSFARGLNDTPKIVGLLLVAKAFDIRIGMVAIAVAMAIGGLLNARKVAETMSRKIAKMNDGQALTANLVTAVLVIFASRLGLPVSTTHVSVGAISGIGVVNGTADRSVIGSILLSWLLTLPIAAVLAAIVYGVSRIAMAG